MFCSPFKSRQARPSSGRIQLISSTYSVNYVDIGTRIKSSTRKYYYFESYINRSRTRSRNKTIKKRTTTTDKFFLSTRPIVSLKCNQKPSQMIQVPLLIKAIIFHVIQSKEQRIVILYCLFSTRQLESSHAIEPQPQGLPFHLLADPSPPPSPLPNSLKVAFPSTYSKTLTRKKNKASTYRF